MFLEISQNSPESTCAKVSFLIKFNKVLKKEALAQVFSCEFCEDFKNIYYYRTSLVAASEMSSLGTYLGHGARILTFYEFLRKPY